MATRKQKMVFLPDHFLRLTIDRLQFAGPHLIGKRTSSCDGC